MGKPDLLLGLIGDNIARSRSPALHRLAGQLAGLDVQYDRLIPKDLGKTFDEVFACCAASGYRGINVTYPYKEHAVRNVTIADPLVEAIGAVNTVLFEATGPIGYNTDYSGFVAAYRAQLCEKPPGRVLLIGAGGVGKAVAFALADLKVADLHIVDRDVAKAKDLARCLIELGGSMNVTARENITCSPDAFDGIINCTPVGMCGHDGTPLDRERMSGGQWAFDAVYTPVETQFLQDAKTAGLQIISGYELFFFQGAHAWTLFSGCKPDEAALRILLRPGQYPCPDRCGDADDL